MSAPATSPNRFSTRQAANKAIMLLSRASARMATMIAENLLANRSRICQSFHPARLGLLNGPSGDEVWIRR